MESQSLFNLNREAHRVHQKKIKDQLLNISKWIESAGGRNSDEAVEFLNKYLYQLNDLTKKSFFDKVLDLTDTRLIDINKINDLINLIGELLSLKKEIKNL